MGLNTGEIIVRSFQEPKEEEQTGAQGDEEFGGIIINTETPSTKVTKNYKYFYRGAYVKAKDDEIKVFFSFHITKKRQYKQRK